MSAELELELGVESAGVVGCGICHASCREPEVLPCSHCYCRQCIHQVALRAGVIRPFPCPECATPTILPTAFFVRAMKEREFRSRHGKKAKELESQDEGSAVQQSSQDEDTGAENRIPTVPEYLMPECSWKCKKYHKKPQEWYCFDCEGFICHACTAKDHRDHDFEFISKAAEETKERLVKQLDSLTESKTVLLHAIEGVQMTRLEIEDQGQSVVDNIESSFGELLEIVNNRKQELVRQTILTVMKKSKHLSEQENDLSTSYALVQSTIDLTEQCVAQSPDDELLLVHTDIQRRIREIEKQQKEREYLEPVEEVDLGVEVNCAEDLKQLCQTKAKLTLLPINVAFTGSSESAEVSMPSHYFFRFSPKLSNGKPTKRTFEMVCDLKSLVNDSTTKCEVELLKENLGFISYTPTVRGRHELFVTVNGQEVAGSPFPVLVSIHPTRLDKPVRVITGIRSPCDVAVTTTGKIIVTGSKYFLLLDRNGEKRIQIDVSRHGVTNPYGVAVDNTDDFIYISDRCSSRIIKLSPDFELLGKLDGPDGSRYRYMAVVGDEVMACESQSNAVMVYTKDLKFVRQVGSYGDGPGQFVTIGGVSSDENRNLYVGNSQKGVQVFSNSGEFLYSVWHPDLVPMWSHCVCVVGQHMYVTSRHIVYVFTTKGGYVASFGYISGFPRGICVDKDGSVYICDYDYNSVEIF